MAQSKLETYEQQRGKYANELVFLDMVPPKDRTPHQMHRRKELHKLVKLYSQMLEQNHR